MFKLIEKTVFPFNLAVISLKVGIWKCCLLIALFNSLGSRQSLKFPLGFSTITRLFTQSVASSTAEMTPLISSSSNASLSFGNKV